MQKKIIIFQDRIAKVGGVETHLYNFCVRLKDYYDIKVLYGTISSEQKTRLSKYVDVEQYDKEKTYKCDICIRNSLYWVIPNNIKADRYIEILHADYEWLSDNIKNNQWDKAEKLGCGEYVAKQYKKIYKLKEDVPYIRNILAPTKKVDKVLHFISATRLDKHKGLHRMLKMCDMLRANNIKFTWDIFTNSNISEKLPQEFRVWEQQYDMFDYVADADYCVLLTDCEGLPYTIQEALQYKTPCIVTDVGGCTELIKDGINGYVVPLDMKFDINKILDIPQLDDYTGTDVKVWCDYLGGAKYIKKEERDVTMIIKVIKTFRDATNNNAYVYAGTTYECDIERANRIVDLGYAEHMPQPKKEKVVEVAMNEDEKETAKVVVKKTTTKKAPKKDAKK